MANKNTSIEKSAPQTIQAVPRTGWTYRPNVDIFDTSEAIVLQADMPGADNERIEVSFEAGVLSIEAPVTPRTRPASARTLVQEYGIGDFHRRFEVDHTAIDTQNVSAEYRDGVLTVHLPKAQQARRQRVPVKAS
jgi:HSP20 family protein